MSPSNRTRFPRKPFSWSPTEHEDRLHQKFNRGRTAKALAIAAEKAEALSVQAQQWDLEARRYALEAQKVLPDEGARPSPCPSEMEETRDRINRLVQVRGRLDHVATSVRRIIRKIRTDDDASDTKHTRSHQPELLHELEKQAQRMLAAVGGLTSALTIRISAIEEPLHPTYCNLKPTNDPLNMFSRSRSSIEYDQRNAARKAYECKSWEQWWRRVEALGDRIHKDGEIVQEFEGACWREFEALGMLAEFNNSALEILSWKARLIITALIELVNSTDKAAAHELYSLACLATTSLNEAVRGRPALVSSFSRVETKWPLMATRRRNRTQIVDENKGLLEQIQLGEKSPFGRLATAHWNLSDRVGQIALALWNYVDQIRRNVERLNRQPNEHWFAFSELEIKASNLTSFSAKTWEEWWKVADEFLEEMLNSTDAATRQTLKRLDEPVGSRRGQVASTKTKEGFKNLRKKLRSRFKSFSGAHR